jgi:(2R)-3-sulfolactate dehydrogenase (NADP+)
MLAIDPAALVGADDYFSRLEIMIGRMLADEGVRLPGVRRHRLKAAALERGLEISDTMHAELIALAK